MPANLRPHFNRCVVSSDQPVLLLSLELGWDFWKLAFTTGPGPAPRRREILARDVAALAEEIAEAKRRLRLPADCRVLSCYEAGRDGFWLHRWLLARGVENVMPAARRSCGVWSRSPRLSRKTPANSIAS
jgi:transposase